MVSMFAVNSNLVVRARWEGISVNSRGAVYGGRDVVGEEGAHWSESRHEIPHDPMKRPSSSRIVIVQS